MIHGDDRGELMVVVGYDAKSSAVQPYADRCICGHCSCSCSARSLPFSPPTFPCALSDTISFTMPPRKKAKASAASTPLADTQPKTPQASGPSQSQDELLNDPWDDEEEIQLLKSMMKWKPTGRFTATPGNEDTINMSQASTSTYA